MPGSGWPDATSGVDAQPARSDTGAAPDAASTIDSGSTLDAATLDAGAVSDAAAGDAAIVADAASADASAADASSADASAADASSADAGSALDAGADPTVAIHVRATTAVFPHADNLAGQTPALTRGGVRSLQLMNRRNDPNAVTLFDVGDNSIEVSYDHGADTLVATVAAAGLTPGRYTLARMVQNWSRYRIDAAYHDLSGNHRGELENVIVMSDGTNLDGTMRDGGYYESTFTSAGASNTTTGDNFVIPVLSTTAGAGAVVENGHWAVYFVVDVEIPANPTQSYEVDCLVNMHESFRWTDTIGVGHAMGVFDFGAIYFEPVVRFGGNDFELTIR